MAARRCTGDVGRGNGAARAVTPETTAAENLQTGTGRPIFHRSGQAQLKVKTRPERWREIGAAPPEPAFLFRGVMPTDGSTLRWPPRTGRGDEIPRARRLPPQSLPYPRLLLQES